MLPVLDVAPLVAGGPGGAAVVDALDDACRTSGFFLATGHGIDLGLLDRLQAEARAFFALDDEEKAAIAMRHGGRAWRGWFPVGGELTSGRPDRKEGLYLGAELGPDDPRVRAGRALHGPNLFPERPAGLRTAVLGSIDAFTALGHRLMGAIGRALGQEEEVRARTADPVVLFRLFSYPPAPAGEDDGWGVAEHTDYGLLTLLLQDDTGGLEVRGADGSWLAVPPVEGALVCNLGDMLESLSGGRYRSTPHRVRSPGDRTRLSCPFFFDPAWEARLPGRAGTYGDYLSAKVARVFPELGEAVLP